MALGAYDLLGHDICIIMDVRKGKEEPQNVHVMRLSIKFNENDLLFYVISMHLQKSLLVIYSSRMEKGKRSMTRQINENLT